MGWSNLIVGYHDLHNVSKAYVNVVNTIATFVEPTTPNNIITKETILTQYSIKQGLIFLKKSRGCSMKTIAAVSWPQSCQSKEASRPHIWTTKKELDITNFTKT